MKIHITITDEKGNVYEGSTNLVKASDVKIRPIKKEFEDRKKPTYAIRQYFLKNFFKEEKKLGEVSKKLDEAGFHFKPGSIQYALDSADYLERRGETGSYRWIQKFPPN